MNDNTFEKQDRRFLISVTENQFKRIMNAVEDDARLRLNQAYIDLVDELCFQGLRRLPDGKYPDGAFERAIDRRDRAREKLVEFFRICSEPDPDRTETDPAVDELVDIWHVMRHFLWEQRPPKDRGNGTDSYEPYALSAEPLPKVWMKEEV